jgi:tripartite-type tricarboxylate transporter receptor subunit TctC
MICSVPSRRTRQLGGRVVSFVIRRLANKWFEQKGVRFVLSRRLAAIAAAFVLPALVPMMAGAAVDTYPAKPIKLVVGFGPGGPADVMARLVAAGLSPILGQSVFVDNRPGAGGMLGAEAVADAEPDGYTLLLGNTANLIISPLLYKEVHYDPAKAFAPVANLGITPNILIVNKASGLKSVQDIIDFARKNPGKLNYASAGIGTPLHLIGEMFKQRLGLDIVHVPYKSGGQSIQAVMAGEVQLTFENPAVALPLVQAGTVRALAVTSAMRDAQAPDVPTLSESGLPDFVVESFTGVVGRAGIPAAIVARLNAVINESLKSPQVAETLVKLAVDAKNETPEQFGRFLAKELADMTPVVKAAGLQGVE